MFKGFRSSTAFKNKINATDNATKKAVFVLEKTLKKVIKKTNTSRLATRMVTIVGGMLKTIKAIIEAEPIKNSNLTTLRNFCNRRKIMLNIATIIEVYE